MTDKNDIFSKAAKKAFVKRLLYDLFLWIVGVLGWIAVSYFVVYVLEDPLIMKGYLITTIGISGIAALLIVVVRARRYRRFLQRLSEFSEEEYKALCEDAEDHYGAYYTSCGYMIIPQLFYIDSADSIKNTQTVFHRTNGMYDGAVVKMYTVNGKKLEIVIGAKHLKEIAKDSGYDSGLKWHR